MKSGDMVDRYRLLELITRDAAASASGASVGDVQLWHAYDTVLDRNVAIRLLDAADSRLAAVVGAAQASALIDDRRLLRVLDILDVPETPDRPPAVAVISEWASGRNLERSIADRQGAPYSAAEAVGLVTDVARALAVAQKSGVAHGRLRPSSVFITDAGEIRLRGLAVDAALFGVVPTSDGATPPDRFAADVDSLGGLLYLLSTATWPGHLELQAPASPRQGDTVLPPSHVRASVPLSVDDLVARSLQAASRPKAVTRFADATAFATAAGTTENYLSPAPAAGPAYRPTGWRKAARTGLIAVGRLIAVTAALALVVAGVWGGITLITSSNIAAQGDPDRALADMLTEAAHPIDAAAGQAIERSYPIVKVRSYDPFGDDNADGKLDKRKGREGDDTVATVNDVDPKTAWLTDTYTAADLDGKGGTGLIVDLGSPQDIREIDVRLVSGGGDVELRAADQVMPDPALWPLLASVPHAPNKLTVRTPRPVTARYVLVWLTSVPPAPEAGYGAYQQGITSVSVRG